MVADDNGLENRLDTAMYYVGTLIFMFLAVLLVFAFVKTRKRNDEYGKGR